MPAVMLLYDQWLDERGMHPRQVDQLSRAELFWLPAVRAAKEDAAEMLRKQEEKQQR